ncbi:MAG: N-acetylneuraminate synthase, partial [Synergistales bacterium]|nr:N-acetylneuraminate synthase [Synergistales bacterium]
VYTDASVSFDWTPILKEECDKVGIDYFSSPYDFEATDKLNEYMLAYKIGSGEIDWIEALVRMAAKGKPVLIATGAATIGEVQKAVHAILAINKELVLMQCNTNYTADPDNYNHIHLNVLKTYAAMFPEVVLGLSDHTPGVHVSVAAVAMGASVVEKHFTLDRSMEGPDHPFAIEPWELKELVRQIREVESAMGDGRKLGPLEEEMEFYHKARRSLHARCDIPAGTVITEDMICCKRPGYGIAPKHSDLVKGRVAKVDIEADQWIGWEMV